MGDKTFGVICQRERVFPKSLAKPRSGGETPSRAAPSCPAWRSHADTVSPHKDVTVVQCASLIGTLPVSRKGRGNCCRGRLRFANRPYTLIGTLPFSRKGRGDCCRGRLRSANRPYRLIAPCASSRGGRGALPLLGAPSPWMLGCRTFLLSNLNQLWQTGSSAVKTGSSKQGAGSRPAGPRSLPNSRSFSSASGWSA